MRQTKPHGLGLSGLCHTKPPEGGCGSAGGSCRRSEAPKVIVMLEAACRDMRSRGYPRVGATAAVGVDVAPPNPKLGAAEVLAGGAPNVKPPEPPAGVVLAPNENVISCLSLLGWTLLSRLNLEVNKILSM